MKYVLTVKTSSVLPLVTVTDAPVARRYRLVARSLVHNRLAVFNGKVSKLFPGRDIGARGLVDDAAKMVERAPTVRPLFHMREWTSTMCHEDINNVKLLMVDSDIKRGEVSLCE